MSKIYVILFLSFICVNIRGASTDSRKAFIKKYKNFNTYSDCYRSGFSPDSLFTDYTHTI